MNPEDTKLPPIVRFLVGFIESFIFQSRWLLIPFYFGLVVVQLCYCVKFCETIYHLLITFWTIEENTLLLTALSTIDIVLIAILIRMIIASYKTLVRNIKKDHTEGASSGQLKVKMAASLIGISSIHLLQSFINSQTQTNREIFVKCTIHVIFVASAIGMAYIDYLHSICPEHLNNEPQTQTH